ncbi:MAG: CTP synthase [Alphaproteobacteria bacterium]|nr:CTP synthase [Alphaproteobacteria bacterium]
MTRYIFVTGGVVSSLGKGLAAAALAALLKGRGYKVHMRKLDPYLNVDPGTMSPSQHGEVYVTDDGAETDLDLGHYERFADITCTSSDAITTGRIYSNVIARERRGDYLGATVQVIPHITDTIKDYIAKDVPEGTDFMIVEVGGTVGDIEGLPYLEAIRQFMNEAGRDRTIFIHLTLIPYIPSADELKTKPSQHSVKELLSVGIQPDILLCRCDRPIPDDAKRKLGLFCNLRPERVLEALDVRSIYEVPLTYAEQGLDVQVLQHFHMDTQTPPNMDSWKEVLQRIQHPSKNVTIAVIAKYITMRDAYKSLIEAISHGGFANHARVDVKWINAETLEEEVDGVLQMKSAKEVRSLIGDVSGILVPGGYGLRGAFGKMAAIRLAREDKIPFLGICFGLQLAVIETARSLAGISLANTTEFGSTPEPVVGLLTEWQQGDSLEVRDHESDLGGTMRLGAYECHLAKDSLAYNVYGQEVVYERHRHRYEVNMEYRERLAQAGLIISGVSKDGKLPEMIERKDHPWFLATQAHPEFKSRPFSPSPIFRSFIEAACDKQQTNGVSYGNTKTG